jgi:hypothetical protein
MEKNSAEEYWEILTFEEKERILKEGNFFDGFRNYLWHYLPNDLKEYVSKINGNFNNHES